MNVGIRLLKIQIRNIKNVKNGKIEFGSKKQIEKGLFDLNTSDVVGIYGPNGSSKTSMINAFEILKSIIVSKNLKENDNKINHFDEKNVYDLISKNADNAILELTYFVDQKEKTICVYEIIIGKNEQTKTAFIKKEKS